MFKPSAITLALSLTLLPVSPQADEQRVIVTHDGLPAPGQPVKPEPPPAPQSTEIKKIDLPDMGDSSGTLISPAEEACTPRLLLIRMPKFRSIFNP